MAGLRPLQVYVKTTLIELKKTIKQKYVNYVTNNILPTQHLKDYLINIETESDV